mmetsp:Transcript_64344/g.121870  ORF Transcript_64344/g.121870 Transcript_64344/m.121870 type:complete len:413 (+) Transcript_64344:44-1282(+)
MCKGAAHNATDTVAIHLIPEASKVNRHIRDRLLQTEFKVQEGKLGSGSSGDVKLAIGKGGGLHAVKSIRKAGLSDQKLSSLEQEVGIHFSLQHPHIVRLDWVFESHLDVHLVMEYLRGGELYDHIARKGELSERAAAKIIHQVMMGVAYLHSHHVLHRDLKPGNIMFADEACECAKIIDMGLATRWDGQAHLTEACGTPLYAAPEIWQQSYTDKAEMWALGVIAHETLLGCSPFPGSSTSAIAMSREGKVIFGNDFNRLTKAAQNFLKCLLAPQPAGRPTVAEALNHPWLLAVQPTLQIGICCNLVDLSAAPANVSLSDNLQPSMLQEQALWDSFHPFDVCQSGGIITAFSELISGAKNQGFVADDAKHSMPALSEAEFAGKEVRETSIMLEGLLYLLRLFSGACVCSSHLA